MKKKIVWKQIVVMLLCCVMMAGNLLGIYAMESYEKDELSGEDTFLGEDSGKQHEVMVQKECEPDVFLGKYAKWDNIEKGLATLTLTEKDTSDWSDNPADYIIVLDRTRTMVLDDLSFWSENDGDISASHSVCLNENHFYMLAGLPVKLIDYNNGLEANGQSLPQNKARLGHGALKGIYQQQYAVGHIEYPLYLSTKVGVTRGINDVNFSSLPCYGYVLGQDGDAAFAFQVVVVHHQLTGMLVFLKEFAGHQHFIHNGGFAVVNVRNYCDVSNVLHTDVFQIGVQN